MSAKHDKIQQLPVRQQCREKVQVWFGSRENFNHPIKELIANSSDEIINNFDEGTITLTLSDDRQTITVEDTGRGIQIGGQTEIENEDKTKEMVDNYKLLFLTLFAGTKYEENLDSTTGTNGVGTTVINYTSEIFDVTSWYSGVEHNIRFENGATNDFDLVEKKCDKDKHGTKIVVKLDNEVYENPKRKDRKVYFTIDEVRDIVQKFAVSSPKLTTIFKHKDKVEEFHYDSLEDYFDEQIGNTSTSGIFTMGSLDYKNNNEVNHVDVIFTTAPDIFQETYLNSTFLEEGGAVYEGVIQGVRHFCNKYCNDNNKFPSGETRFIRSDIEDSISFVATVMSSEVEFENQTKLSTAKKLYQDVVEQHVNQILQVVSIDKKDEFEKFINHLLTVQKNADRNRQANRRLRTQLTRQVQPISNRVESLKDCKRKGKGTELFIAEGQSALGSILGARDAEFQAVYPLRGKILNCVTASYSRIFNNEIIANLIRVLGCGIVHPNKDIHSFNIDNLNYDKIIIAVDADADGAQIACQLIAMFHRLMPELLIEGKIYIAHTPLYELIQGGKSTYYYSEQEKEQEIKKVTGRYKLFRRKGLGEMSPDKMKETAMDAETRKLKQIIVDDIDGFEDVLIKWFGSGRVNIDRRKEHISNNLEDFIERVIE